MQENLGFSRKCSRAALFAASASILAVVAGQSTAHAQSRAKVDEKSGEIIVTATKRSESIREVPLAITAVSGETIREANLDDVKDLITLTPGVTGNSKDSFIDAVAVRGIRTQDFGVGGDPSVGFFKNGIHQGRNGSAVSSLYDMDRAEILRGPQNFLFGRNAIAGAISVHTARPEFDAVSGYVEVDGGSRGHFVTEGALNIPVSENFAIRAAGYYSRENGYVNNAFAPNAKRLLGHEKWAGRFSADYESGPLTIQFTYDHEDRDQAGSLYRATRLDSSAATLESLFGPLNLPSNFRDINSDNSFGNYDRGKSDSLGLRIDYDLGPAILTSQTGFKHHSYHYREDFDGTRFNINNFGLDQSGDYFEQELRLVSAGDGPFSWYVGASYYKEDLDALFTAQGDEELLCSYYYNLYYGTNLNGTCLATVYNATAVPEGLLEQGVVKGKYHGYAAYVDLSYEFSDTVDLSLGMRYSKDTKTFSNNILPVTSALGPFFTYSVTTNGPLTDKKSWDAFTPRAILRYRPNSDQLFFASATRGFKSGGFGTFGFSPVAGKPAIGFGDVLQPGDAVPDDFNPEKLWSFELGHKGSFLGGDVKTDINFFYYNYKDLQLLVFQNGGGLIFNLGNVKGYGAEGSITTRLGDNFDAVVSGAWNKTDLTGAGAACSIASCDGNNLGTPEFSGAASLNAHFPAGPGEIFAAADLFWESKKGGGIENSPVSTLPGFAELGLKAGYRGDSWKVTAYVENVTNKIYYDQGNNNGGIIPAHYFGPSRPRTFGIRLSKTFGK